MKVESSTLIAGSCSLRDLPPLFQGSEAGDQVSHRIEEVMPDVCITVLLYARRLVPTAFVNGVRIWKVGQRT